jgi:hypothetical protein
MRARGRAKRGADRSAEHRCGESLAVTGRLEKIAAGNPEHGVAGLDLSKNPRKQLIRSYWAE